MFVLLVTSNRSRKRSARDRPHEIPRSNHTANNSNTCLPENLEKTSKDYKYSTYPSNNVSHALDGIYAEIDDGKYSVIEDLLRLPNTTPPSPPDRRTCPTSPEPEQNEDQYLKATTLNPKGVLPCMVLPPRMSTRGNELASNDTQMEEKHVPDCSYIMPSDDADNDELHLDTYGNERDLSGIHLTLMTRGTGNGCRPLLEHNNTSGENSRCQDTSRKPYNSIDATYSDIT
jgi:hypothetical protein